MKLNANGRELRDIWERNFFKENDRLGGNSAEGDYVNGWCIIDNKRYIKNITDECGLLLYAYSGMDAIGDEYVFAILNEWEDDCDNIETDRICAGFTIPEVRNELMKYFEED